MTDMGYIINVTDPATGHNVQPGYIIAAAEEIRRVLVTPKGSIPMNPDYGSDLYLYRDRTLDGETTVGIIGETFDAIERNVRQAVPTRVQVSRRDDGVFALDIDIKRRETHVRAYAA